MIYEVANLQGIGNRVRQEDAFAFGNALDHKAISECGLLIAVADGMGGMQGGKIASETAVMSVLRSFASFDMKGDIPEQLNNAVSKANGQVYEKLHEAGGSTLTLGLIFREKLWFSSVGDSFLFLLRNRRLTRINRSQNIQNQDYLDAILMGVIDTETAEQDPERRAITQFLGMEQLEETDFFRRPLRLEPGDVLLFCYVHPLFEHRWGQRVVRFYDPDRHIIEVGEKLDAVILRFMERGLSAEETAVRMDIPVDFVTACLEKG